MDSQKIKDVLHEWREMLADTLTYHADRLQLHLKNNGRTKISALKNKFFSHPFVLNYKEKIGFDLEHLSHRLSGAVTHRDWHALLDALKSIVASKQRTTNTKQNKESP